MRILNVSEPVCYEFVDTDEEEYPEYRRAASGCWERAMGESWETVMFPEALEVAYQLYIWGGQVDQDDVLITQGDVVKAVQFLREYAAKRQDDEEYSGLIWSVCVASVAAGNWLDLDAKCGALLDKLGELGSKVEQQAAKLGVAVAALAHLEPSALSLLAATEHGDVHDSYWQHATAQARRVVEALDTIRGDGDKCAVCGAWMGLVRSVVGDVEEADGCPACKGCDWDGESDECLGCLYYRFCEEAYFD